MGKNSMQGNPSQVVGGEREKDSKQSDEAENRGNRAHLSDVSKQGQNLQDDDYQVSPGTSREKMQNPRAEDTRPGKSGKH